MGREIERKFLLKNDSWRPWVQRSRPMVQGYLCGNPRASVRVRIAGDEAHLNIKSATLGVERTEFEYTIPLADARLMLRELAGDLVEKIRHEVPHGGHLWEIDEFEGMNRGLVVAEVELTDSAEAFERPDWLGDEVSGEARYYNTELARHPYTRW